MNIVLADQIVSSIPQLQSTCIGSYVNTVLGSLSVILTYVPSVPR